MRHASFSAELKMMRDSASAPCLRPCSANRASPRRRTTRTQSSNCAHATKNDSPPSLLMELRRDKKKNKKTFCYATPTVPFESSVRRISTPRLNALQHFHLAPINVVISHESITIPYLGAGFPLRCFQRLSDPDIATGRCTWRYSPQTRGQFIRVLSYY